MPNSHAETQTPDVVVTTNIEVAERIGLSHSSVSRIRSGDRLPSIDVMANIAESYGWDFTSQVHSRQAGTYADDFEAVISGAARK